MQPNNYVLPLPQNALASSLAGVQGALQMSQGMAAEAADRERAALIAEQRRGVEMQNQALELAAQERVRIRSEINELMKAPTTENIAAFVLRNPSMAEAYKQPYEMAGKERQQTMLRVATQVDAALAQGEVDVAKGVLSDYAQAARDTGDAQSAKMFEFMADRIAANPNAARVTTNGFLLAAMGPEPYKQLMEQRRANEKQPAELRAADANARRAESEAASAAVKAKFAESDAALDLQKKGWDIAKLQADTAVARANASLAVLQAQAEKELAPLRRQELEGKIQQAQRDRDRSTRERAAELQNSLTTLDNALNQIERIKNNPELNDVVGSVEGSWIGTALSILSDRESQAIGDIEAITATAFLQGIQQAGSAAGITEVEGKKFERAAQNLSRAQSEKAFKEALDEYRRLLLKNRDAIATKHGIPLPKPDTPRAAGGAQRPPLDSFEIGAGGSR